MKNTALKKTTIKVVGVVGIAALSGSLQAASFDCAKAAASVEKLICSDEATSTLDSDLDRAYKVAIEKSKNKDGLKQQQRTWLKEQRNACKDTGCLTKTYQVRIDELLAVASNEFDTSSLKSDNKKVGSHKFPLTFKLVYGDSYPICQPYVDMLNKTKYMEYPACERKILPEYKQFKALAWEAVTDEQEIIKAVEEGIKWQHASFMGLDTAGYRNAIKGFRLQMKNKEVSLFKTLSDDDGDGSVEVIYKRVSEYGEYKQYNSCKNISEFYVIDSALTFDSVNEYNRKGFDSLTFSGSDEVFLINGKLYQNAWKGSFLQFSPIEIWSISSHKEKICGIDIE